MSSPTEECSGPRSAAVRYLVWLWLTAALPLAGPRRAVAAPLPIYQGPFLAPFGDMDEATTVAVADIDGDGDLDVFVFAGLDGVRFFRNTGSPQSAAFAPASPSPFGLSVASARSIAAFGDLDGDGDLDVLVERIQPYPDQSGPTLAFVENTGSPSSPSFTEPVVDPFGLGGFSQFAFLAPALFDLDGNGLLDVLVTASVNDQPFHCWFANTGTASSPAFATPTFNPFGLPTPPYNQGGAPTFADLDGDGDFDFIEVDGPSGLRFAPNTGSAVSPAFGGVTDDPPSGLIPGWQTAFADIDSDGDLDLFDVAYAREDVWQGLSARASLLVIPNTGGAHSPAFEPPNPFGLRHLAALVDIDGDGDLDASESRGLAENVGGPESPEFAAPVSGSIPIGTFADLDGDGDLDSIYPRNKQTCLAQNTGTATSPAFASCTFLLDPMTYPLLQSLADIDGDGDLDAFVGDAYAHVFAFMNTGSSVSPAFDHASVRPFGIPDMPGVYQDGESYAFANATLIDIDRDGDFDLFVGVSDGTSLFFENTGTGTSPAFAPLVADAFGLDRHQVIEYAGLTFGDIDGDGDLDVFVDGSASGALFFRNLQGSRVFANGFEQGDLGAWSSHQP